MTPALCFSEGMPPGGSSLTYHGYLPVRLGKWIWLMRTPIEPPLDIENEHCSLPQDDIHRWSKTLWPLAKSSVGSSPKPPSYGLYISSVGALGQFTPRWPLNFKDFHHIPEIFSWSWSLEFGPQGHILMSFCSLSHLWTFFAKIPISSIAHILLLRETFLERPRWCQIDTNKNVYIEDFPAEHCTELHTPPMTTSSSSHKSHKYHHSPRWNLYMCWHLDTENN